MSAHSEVSASGESLGSSSRGFTMRSASEPRRRKQTRRQKPHNSTQSSRHRRSHVELVADCLQAMSKSQRMEVISKWLSQCQRRELEEFMLKRKQGQQQQEPPRCGPGQAAVPETAATRKRPRYGTEMAQRSAEEPPAKSARTRLWLKQAAGCLRNRAQPGLPKGLCSHLKGSRMYYAVVCVNQVVLRSRSVHLRRKAERHLEVLQRLKEGILDASSGQSFEERLQAAVQQLTSSADVADMGACIYVRVATCYWIGRDLATPTFHLNQVEAALLALKRLQAARGEVRVGGRGLLCHHSAEKAMAIWQQIRGCLLELAIEAGRDADKLGQLLDEKVRQHQARRLTVEARFAKWREAAKMRQQRKEQRSQNALERARQKEAARRTRELARANQRSQRALKKLEQIMLRWRVANAPKLQATALVPSMLRKLQRGRAEGPRPGLCS